MVIIRFHLILVLIFFLINVSKEELDVIVVTSVKSNTDVFQRFLRSSKVYNLDVKVIDQEGSMPCETEEGYCKRDTIGKSVLLPLRKILQEFKDDENKIVIILNSPNVIFNSRKRNILKKFKRFGAKVVFSADVTCHPDIALKSKYPKIKKGKAYLSSAGFMGHASVLYKIINEHLNNSTGDDQLFFTELYLDENIRRKYGMRVDHTSRLFQTLNEEGEFDIIYRRNDAHLSNKPNNFTPGVIIGSDSSPSLIDMIGDYIARSYSPHDGCLQCYENTINLNKLGEAKYPTVLIGIFIWRPTPFFEEFLKYLNDLNYPKSKLHLFIHLGDTYNQRELEEYVNTYQDHYLSVKYDGLRDHVKEWQAKTEAVRLCVSLNCDYYFNVDSTTLLTRPEVLRHLIKQNRSVIAPILTHPGSSYRKSNIWRSTKENAGFDYNDIALGKRVGLWTASYVTSAYLVNGTLLQSKHTQLNFYSTDQDADMAFCQHMRKNNVLLYVTNKIPWGYLMFSKNFNTSHVHNDLHDIRNNMNPWQRRYLTDDYLKYVGNIIKPEQPCPGVHLLRVFTHRFNSEFIDEMIHYGKWSGAKHEDDRRPNGYDPFPTDDIALEQAGFGINWQRGYAHILTALRDLAFPTFKGLSERIGSYVVRYNGDVSAKIQPHTDNSSYTVNVALSDHGIDYEGGGVHFVTENCSVTGLKKGWMLLHLGTKEHESLKVTKGTRYVLVSLPTVVNNSRIPQTILQG